MKDGSLFPIKDPSLIQLSSAFKLKWFFVYPAKYLIQLMTGSRTEHDAMLIRNNIREQHTGSHKKTPWPQYLVNLAPWIDIFIYELKVTLTEHQLDLIESFWDSRKDVRFGITGYIFSRIPLLNKIKFHSADCSQTFIMSLQIDGVELIPKHIDAAAYSPNTSIDLLTKYNLIEGRRLFPR